MISTLLRVHSKENAPILLFLFSGSGKDIIFVVTGTCNDPIVIGFNNSSIRLWQTLVEKNKSMTQPYYLIFKLA